VSEQDVNPESGGTQENPNHGPNAEDNREHNPNAEQNQNPQPNFEQDDINHYVNEMRVHTRELRNSGEPSRLSLTTSIENSIDSLIHAHQQLTDMTQFRARMREYYSIGISKEAIKDLNITKAQLYSMFTEPKTGQPPNITKPRVCMDWCHYQPWRDNWMQRWFMVYDKPPCNNREVPQYFLRQLWVEFVLGLHVNYFDITEFHDIGLGST